MGPAVLITLLMLGSAAGTTPAPKLELHHSNTLDDSYQLETITWWLDGATLATWRQGEEDPSRDVVLHVDSLEPGMHSLAVTAVYEGHSKLFPYLNGYRFHMRARAIIDARPGYVIQVNTNAFAEGGFTVDWRDRPKFRLDGVPKKAFLDEELLPIEGQPPGTDMAPEIALAPANAEGAQPGTTVPAVAKAPASPTACSNLQPIQFDFAGFRLNARARKRLDQLSACMVKNPAMRVRLDGHCDARGSEGFNVTLASWRIDSARRYLISRGVLPGRIDEHPFGKSRLLCQDNTETCHARNRRVAFEVESD